MGFIEASTFNNYDSEKGRRFYADQEAQQAYDSAWKYDKYLGCSDRNADCSGQMAVARYYSLKDCSRPSNKKRSFLSFLYSLIFVGLMYWAFMLFSTALLLLLFRDFFMFLKIVIILIIIIFGLNQLFKKQARDRKERMKKIAEKRKSK